MISHTYRRSLATEAISAHLAMEEGASVGEPFVLVEAVDAGLISDLTVVPHPADKLANDVSGPRGDRRVNQALLAIEVDVFGSGHVMPNDVSLAEARTCGQIGEWGHRASHLVELIGCRDDQGGELASLCGRHLHGSVDLDVHARWIALPRPVIHVPVGHLDGCPTHNRGVVVD